MSTPITHNQLFTASVMEALTETRGGCVNSKLVANAAMEVIRKSLAYYNYPDACQAVKRHDGTMLSRRITHFEKAKDLSCECNSHKIFDPEFLRSVTEHDTVSAVNYHDTKDQEGEFMGRYTDFVAFKKAINQYKTLARSHKWEKDALLLATMFCAHLEIADFYNDLWHRDYVTVFDDGQVRIGSEFFERGNKATKAFRLLKSTIMKLQENVSANRLSQYDMDLEALNKAIETSYKDAYSPWLAANTLHFVKPITLTEEKLSDEEIDFLGVVEISQQEMLSRAEEFTDTVVVLTAHKLRKVIKYILIDVVVEGLR